MLSETSAVVPEVEITWAENLGKEPDYVVVAPTSLGVLINLFASKAVGSIRISSKAQETEEASDNDDDYDEDTQLYKSMNKSVLFKSVEFPILHLDTKVSVLAILVPYFLNSIAYNVLARALRDDLRVSHSWITLSPSSLNNGQSLNRLDGGDVSNRKLPKNSTKSYFQVPKLEPPHSVTGIAAALNSVLYPDNVFVSLILNSDGQIGFERTDSDSIVDAAYVLSELVLADNDYTKTVSKAIRKFNSTNNAGMYL